MTKLRRITLGLALGALVAGAAGASRVPEESRKRAARTERWQASLEAAAAAAAVGRASEAESLYREVLEQAASPDGSAMRTAQAADGLADLYRTQGRMAQAAPLYVEAVALWERLLGASQPRLAVTLHNLGVVYTALEDWDAAQRTLDRALAIWEASLGADSVEAGNTRRARDTLLGRLAAL